MKNAIKWTALTAGCALLLPVVIFGPNRLHSIVVGDEKFEGTVAMIQPTGTSDSTVPKRYLVELNMDDRRVQMFPSSDQKWSLISKGERVITRLYASPPWSADNSRWQDAALLGVYWSPQKKAQVAKRAAPGTKPRPLVTHTSAAASLMLLAIFVQSLRKRKQSMQ